MGGSPQKNDYSQFPAYHTSVVRNPVDAEALGARERTKLEKRRRITIAARMIFSALGYEKATTSAIAKQAGVANGTLFLYARDKHELLLMVLNDELERITEASVSALNGKVPLVNQLVAFYEPRFAFWASDVDMARAATEAIYTSRPPGDAGLELGRVHRRQRRLVTALATAVDTEARKRRVALRRPAEAVADAIHFLYIGELRVWLNGKRPRAAAALARLEVLFGLLVGGIFTGRAR
jgi:AcrR family transcriptional regulator